MTPKHYAEIAQRCQKGPWAYLLHASRAILQSTQDYGIVTREAERLPEALNRDLHRLLAALPQEFCAIPLCTGLAWPEGLPAFLRLDVLHDCPVMLSRDPLAALKWLEKQATAVKQEVITQTLIREFGKGDTPAQSPEAARRRVTTPEDGGGLL